MPKHLIVQVVTKLGRTKSETLHDHILDVASDLFYKYGINNVGISRIIADAGVAKMTLYGHFGSKDDLVVNYLETRSKAWVDWYRSEVYKMDLSPAQRLRNSFEVLDTWFRSKNYRGCLVANAVIELANDDKRVLRVKEEYYANIRKMYRDLAQEADYENHMFIGEQFFLILREAMMSAHLDGPDGVVKGCHEYVHFILENARKSS